MVNFKRNLTVMKNKFLLHLLFLFMVFPGHSQDNSEIYYQVIRGTIVDKQTQTPLPGANIILLNSETIVGTTSDSNGEFRMNYLAAELTRYQNKVSCCL